MQCQQCDSYHLAGDPTTQPGCCVVAERMMRNWGLPVVCCLVMPEACADRCDHFKLSDAAALATVASAVGLDDFSELMAEHMGIEPKESPSFDEVA